jgi:AcrR family transcriptional regulator
MFIFVKTTKGEQTRQRIVERALALFEQRGYANTTLRDIADAAGVAIGLAYRYFRRKEELVLALYEQLSREVERRVKLPAGSIGERWAALEKTRFQVLAPHRRTLLALVQASLDPESELGALSPATAPVRARWLGLHRAAVTGATGPAAPDALVQLLYALDLMLIVAWMQDTSTHARNTRAAIERLAPFIDLALAMPGAAAAIAELARSFPNLQETSP